jgi:protein-tyrosine-phosphatase
MAEALLRKKLPEELKHRVRVVSAGTFALEGSPASLPGFNVAEQFDVDLSHHHSQPLTPWLISHSDVILVMDTHQLISVRTMNPTAALRTFLLKEFGLPSGSPEGVLSIMDPITGDEEVYRVIYQELDEEITRIIPYLARVVESVG